MYNKNRQSLEVGRTATQPMSIPWPVNKIYLSGKDKWEFLKLPDIPSLGKSSNYKHPEAESRNQCYPKDLKKAEWWSPSNLHLSVWLLEVLGHGRCQQRTPSSIHWQCQVQLLCQMWHKPHPHHSSWSLGSNWYSWSFCYQMGPRPGVGLLWAGL